MTLRRAARFEYRAFVPARLCLALFIALAASRLHAAELTPDAINSAEPAPKALSNEKATPLGVRLQVLLARAHFSPGEIDGKFGENAKKALRGYAEAQQLPPTDKLSDDVWQKLATDTRPVLSNYTITKKDVAGPFLQHLPGKMEHMKSLRRLSYTSAREELAERFHMSEALLASLNPGQHFDRADESIIVADTRDNGAADPVKAARVEVDKNRQVVKLFDRSGALIGFYPATVGSEEKPSPIGTFKVTAITRNPTYRYNPDYHFKGVHTKKPFEIAPGPNNPVGTVWISLSDPGYGIHGTPNPGKVSKAESHGCVRLTNWDADEVASLVSRGTPVDFVDDRSS